METVRGAKPQRQSLGAVGTTLCVFWWTYILSAALAGMYFGLLPALLLRPLSRKLHAKLTQLTVACWCQLCLLLPERVNGARVRITGQLPPPDVSVLLISNHKCDLDYFFVWALASRVGPLQAGGFNAVAKSVLRKVPVMGWVFKLVNFLFLSRSWEADASKIGAWTRAALFSARSRPTWLLLYPEGTRFTAAGKVKSDAASLQAGLPAFKGELLLPRHKGFLGLADALLGPGGTTPAPDGAYRYVLDITICYIGRDGRPVGWNALGTSVLLALGAGRLPLSRILVHSELHPASSLPAGDEPRREWLLERWRRKEALLAHAAEHGRFPDVSPAAAAAAAAAVPLGPLIQPGLEEERMPGLRAATVWLFATVTVAAMFHLLATTWQFRVYALCTTLGVATFAYLDPVF